MTEDRTARDRRQGHVIKGQKTMTYQKGTEDNNKGTEDIMTCQKGTEDNNMSERDRRQRQVRKGQKTMTCQKGTEDNDMSERDRRQ